MRRLFTLCCVVVVLLAVIVGMWSAQQGPPAEHYSFTDIRAEPWHRTVCLPALIMVLVLVYTGTRNRLPR